MSTEEAMQECGRCLRRPLRRRRLRRGAYPVCLTSPSTAARSRRARAADRFGRPRAGIHIPSLCYLAERSAIGSCRVCVVDVEGQDAPVPACTTRVVDGMQVQTATERVLKYRTWPLTC